MSGVEALFVLHRDRLFRYLCRAVGHTEDARDLTQDVFLRATRSAQPAPAGDAARAWLFTIARNLALDHHRRRKSERASVELARPASQETGAAVQQALATLGDVDRDVFLMRESAGLSYDEIARVCGLSPDAVRSRIHRARLQLREQLSGAISARRAQPMRKDSK